MSKVAFLYRIKGKFSSHFQNGSKAFIFIFFLIMGNASLEEEYCDSLFKHTHKYTHYFLLFFCLVESSGAMRIIKFSFNETFSICHTHTHRYMYTQTYVLFFYYCKLWTNYLVSPGNLILNLMSVVLLYCLLVIKLKIAIHISFNI